MPPTLGRRALPRPCQSTGGLRTAQAGDAAGVDELDDEVEDEEVDEELEDVLEEDELSDEEDEEEVLAEEAVSALEPFLARLSVR
jgi:hypothetical protein